jgi:hypothetical protein
VRFDRGLEAVDPDFALQPANGADHRLLLADGSDLFVVRHPPFEIVVEVILGTLADADHRRAHLREAADELPLIRGKRGFNEDNVHLWDPLGTGNVAWTPNRAPTRAQHSTNLHRMR